MSDRPDPASEIGDRFIEFFDGYYQDEIDDLAENYPDERSLYIDWHDLYRFDPDLADDFLTKPTYLRDFAEEGLRLYDEEVRLGQAHVRVRNLPDTGTVPIRDIRSSHLGGLIQIPGVVRSVSSVDSYPMEAAFECQRCGTLTRLPQSPTGGGTLSEPEECQGCERQGPFKLNRDQTQYVDFRQFRIESPLTDQSGESPESIIVNALDDLAEQVEAGTTVEICGVVNTVDRSETQPTLDATIHDKYIKAVSITPMESRATLSITEADKKQMVELSNEADLHDQLVGSIAPHVHGFEKEKLALALQLFGGVKKELPDGTTIPGSIHIGLISDPGMFTDELVEYAARLAPKSVSVSGTDTTQVGLTTAAYKSSSAAKNWELDAGALVLADQGLACITHLSQLDSNALVALQSVMRDREVAAHKGTAAQTLSAETTILASMKPRYGRFDQYEPIGEQIDLPPELFSEFDLLFPHSDQPDAETDRSVAEGVLEANYVGEANAQKERGHTSVFTDDEISDLADGVTPAIDSELLRKYVAYARRNCFPTMTEAAKQEIEDFYVELRMKGQDEDAPVPVTARKLEGLVRLAEASARARLSDTVEESDAERAVSLVDYCLKCIGIDPEVGEFGEDVVEEGTTKSERDRLKNVEAIISDIESEYDEGAPVDVVVERAEEMGIGESKAEHTVEQLKQQGEVYEPRTDYLRTT